MKEEQTPLRTYIINEGFIYEITPFHIAQGLEFYFEFCTFQSLQKLIGVPNMLIKGQFYYIKTIFRHYADFTKSSNLLHLILKWFCHGVSKFCNISGGQIHEELFSCSESICCLLSFLEKLQNYEKLLVFLIHTDVIVRIVVLL